MRVGIVAQFHFVHGDLCAFCLFLRNRNEVAAFNVYFFRKSRENTTLFMSEHPVVRIRTLHCRYAVSNSNLHPSLHTFLTLYFVDTRVSKK